MDNALLFYAFELFLKNRRVALDESRLLISPTFYFDKFCDIDSQTCN
ncbi:hypothetical protein ACVWYG_003343 [Pedobacter sp. UYEF25]